MKTHVIPIGNSKGIRIPSPLLKLCHIQSEVDLYIKGHNIVISPATSKPRTGWEEAFKQMHARGEDQLLIADGLELDMAHWEW